MKLKVKKVKKKFQNHKNEHYCTVTIKAERR